jgi:ATP-dependent DNA ligase
MGDHSMKEYLDLEHARAKEKNPELLWNDSDWIAEEKFDGWRFHYHLGRELDRVYMTGRRTSLRTGRLSEKGHLVPPLWSDLNIGYTVMDGEILPPPGAKFEDIAGIMNVDDPAVAAMRMKEIGEPRYVAFDLLFLDGEDVREECQITRKTQLKYLLSQLNHPLISIAETFDSKFQAYEDIVNRGGEGIILKNRFLTYGEGWIKVKKYTTHDVIITDFTEGKGKYLGQIGAAMVSVYGSNGRLLEVGRVSGMSDMTRRDMSENFVDWLGQVIEIRAQGWAKNRLRHPRFKRSRPDVGAKSCTWAKMKVELRLEEPIRPGQQCLDI